MQGGVAKHVTRKIDTEDNCAVYVKQEYPEAPGATWLSIDGACYAEFGYYVASSSLHRTCLFHQGYISYISLKLNTSDTNKAQIRCCNCVVIFILLQNVIIIGNVEIISAKTVFANQKVSYFSIEQSHG